MPNEGREFGADSVKQAKSRLWTRYVGALGVLIVAIVGGFMVVRSASQDRGTNSSAAALADFTTRVEDYVKLQKKLAAKVGTLDETKSPEQIATREKLLGEAVRAARAGAKEGDILTPAAAAVFTTVIREEFAERSKLAIQDRDEAQDELPNFMPTVNQVYPTTYPLATFPPGVLKRIPPLPEPLEYRFVQRHLIIRDSEANLIVDVLKNAAPPAALPSPLKTETK
jgi:hypothetical protein